MIYINPRPELDPAVLELLEAPDEEPETDRRPELSEFWARVMRQYPEVRKCVR